MANNDLTILLRTIIQEVKGLYAQNEIHTAVFDLLASGKFISQDTTCPQLKTEVDEVASALEAKHKACKHTIEMLLYTLAGLSVGDWVVGRRTQKTRLLWNVDPVSLGKCAQGKADELKVLFETKIKPKNIRYDFQLRPHLKIHFDLPSDLTQGEAQRVSDFIKTCLTT